MSAFIPGLGQLYNGQYIKAGLFAGGELILLNSAIAFANSYKSTVYTVDASVGMVGFLVGLWLGVRVWGVVDAFSSARDINEKSLSDGNRSVTLIYFPKDGVQNVGLAIHF
jgi:TM2 domain-containing membrane protein YozV